MIHDFDEQRLAQLLGIPFSEEQLEAITAPLRPGVIIAGAGTGKTTVMAARVVWLVATGQVAPEQVLGLTFTRKAAAELAQRVDTSLDSAGLSTGSAVENGRPTVLTYDSFAGQLVAEHGLRLGIEPGQTMITHATRFRLAMQAVSQTKAPLPTLREYQPATIANYLLKLDAEMLAHLIRPEEVLEQGDAFDLELGEVKLYRGKPTRAVAAAQRAIRARRELLGLVLDYRELKAQRGLVEFTDQMARAAQLAVPGSQVGRQVREKFAVVLLDEYQDTSSAQAQVLRGLFSGPEEGSGRGHPVTAVGDPFQAIYGWRGAAPGNILQFATDFPRADGSDADSYLLMVNRRSRPVILQAANALSAPLRADDRLLGASDQSAASRTLRAPDEAEGGVIRVASFDTWPEETTWIADQIVAARESGAVPTWSQIAVLTRTNALIGDVYRDLVNRDVPVEIVGLGGLLEVPEIADIVATLQLIDDETANPELVRLLSGPRWQIGPRDLAALAARAVQLSRAAGPTVAAKTRVGIEAIAGDDDQREPLSLLDAVDDLGAAVISDTARRRLAAFAAELRMLRGHRHEPVLELVHRVIETSGVALELESDPQSHAAGRVRQLVQFTEAVAGYVDIDGDGALGGLLAWLASEREQAEGLDQAVPSNADSVKLLTMHRAKGLEWDLVFLPGMADKLFPSGQGADNWTTQAAVLPNELRGDADWVPQLEDVTSQELKDGYPARLRAAQRQAEDRLAYVAVTRARNQLVATTHHWIAVRKTARELSPYLLALEEVCAEYGQPGALCAASQVNPLDAEPTPQRWPALPDQAQQAVLSEAAQLVRHADTSATELGTTHLDVIEQAKAWRTIADSLVADEFARRRPRQTVMLPASVSASAFMWANRDQADLARQLLRPMPRPVNRQAGVGTAFHEWLETRFGLPTLFEADEFESAPDDADDALTQTQLRRLIRAFERGQYANRTPSNIEEPFVLVIAGQQIRGRIDAVFHLTDDPDHDFQVVDWKTSTRPADALQLSLYRLAWAQSAGVPPERVDAVFYHVLSDEVERPERLLSAAEVVALLPPAAQPADRVAGVPVVDAMPRPAPDR